MFRPQGLNMDQKMGQLSEIWKANPEKTSQSIAIPALKPHGRDLFQYVKGLWILPSTHGGVSRLFVKGEKSSDHSYTLEPSIPKAMKR